MWTGLLTQVLVVVVKHSDAILYPPVFPSATSCGPCECWGTAADCSSLSLTSVPHNGLPPTITSLTLRNNSISSLPARVFQGFQSLVLLDVSNNHLHSLTHDVFFGLGSLRSLHLAHNQLHFNDQMDVLEYCFTLLSALTHLDLSHNFLNNISHVISIGWKTRLQWLDLSYNNITVGSESTSPLISLSNLTFLDLSHNSLSHLNGQLFVGVNNLQYLNLSYNQISLHKNAYPQGVFEPFRESLLDLRLERNCRVANSSENLSYPDQALSKLSTLRFLHIDGLPCELGPGFQNLTSLTNLSLSGLDGGFCCVNTLRNNTLLHIPSSLRSLNISRCNISRIETDALRPLRKLTVLDLSDNRDLGFETLGDAMYSLEGSNLRELHVNAIVHSYAMCVLVTELNTRHFKNTSLETIYAKNNRLEMFCEGALMNMPDTLTSVIVDKNRLGFGSYLRDLASLSNLKHIQNDGHQFALYPPTGYPPDHLQQCSIPSVVQRKSGMNCHLFWHSEDAPLATQTAEFEEYQGASTLQPIIFQLPPNLDTFVSRWDNLNYRMLKVEFDPNNSLAVLDLNSNLITTWIGPITGLNRLLALDLGGNFANNVSTGFFKTVASLKHLNVSRNLLHTVIEKDAQGELFSPLGQLENLDLSDNHLNKLPRNIFKGLVSLQTLILSKNSIYSFVVNITHMKNLSHLDLSDNSIHYLNQFIMDHLDVISEYKNVTVYLTSNPIACICKRIHFLTWLQNSRISFPGGTTFSCSMSDGSFRKEANIFDIIDSLQNSCTDTFGILVGAVSCFFCFLVAILSALIHRFRWKLRYLYYASRLAFRCFNAHENEDFQFDAFVSYSSEDNDFVHHHLIEELESRAGLHLNVHNRDFIPGRPIPCNIVDAVQSSRRTLVVLSRELLKSEWCHYEMQMATMEAAHTGRDVLLFLLYEDVSSQDMPRDMLYNLQSSTYITYPSQADPPLLRDFWARLAQAIRQ